MLKGISPLISPGLLDALYRMGHGDTIVFGDAHFPAESLGVPVVRADGLKIADLLGAVLPLFELDTFVDDPVAMMAPVEGDQADPEVEAGYQAVINQYYESVCIAKIERFAFYEASRAAFAAVATGETAKYGNVILKKGVTPA